MRLCNSVAKDLSYLCRRIMDLQSFFTSLLNVVCEMAPYLLLGFLIAGVLHVFVPQKFYANYLSRKNRLSVLWAALLGVPLPLCSSMPLTFLNKI